MRADDVVFYWYRGGWVVLIHEEDRVVGPIADIEEALVARYMNPK